MVIGIVTTMLISISNANISLTVVVSLLFLKFITSISGITLMTIICFSYYCRRCYFIPLDLCVSILLTGHFVIMLLGSGLQSDDSTDNSIAPSRRKKVELRFVTFCCR